MIPASFDYHAPTSLSDAISLLNRLGPDAKILTGGQSLLPLLKLRLGQVSHLVDLARVPGLVRGLRAARFQHHPRVPAAACR